MRSQTSGAGAPAILVAAALVMAASSSCSRALFVPPAGPGAPAPDAAAVWAAATAPCRDVRAYSALLTLSGRIAGQRFPGLTVNGAFTREGAAHLQAQYSGRQIFLLAGRADRASLWLREDDRVVTAPVPDIVDALAGVRLSGADLLAILSGCATADLGMTAAQQFGGMLAVTTAGGRVFLERAGAGRRIRAAALGDLIVEYPGHQPGLPAEVRLDTARDREPAVSLRFRAEQVALDETLPAQLFALPSGASSAAPMTLDELRDSGPLRVKSR